jgi:hypothetical protein
MQYATAQLTDLVSEAQHLSSRTMSTFGHLSYEQLNWKPSPERWSVGQCFDHLVASGASFFPIIDEVAAGRKTKRALESVPLLPKLFGKLLIKSLDPTTTRKMKAPKQIEPATSAIDSSILQSFVQQQSELVSKMNATANLDVERLIITSPVASFVTYSLLDAYRIIVVHEERHFQQAQRVTMETAFPK